MDERDNEARAVKQAGRALQQRASEATGHERRERAADAELAAWSQARREADTYRTVEERAADQRRQLYVTLKAHNAIDVYYKMYPDERPQGEQVRAQEGRER